MPRAKRALSGSESTTQAPSKRRSIDPPASTSQQQKAVDLAAKTNGELSALLRDLGLPHSGNKAQLVRRLEAAGIAAGVERESDWETDVSEESLEELKYVTICRPYDDIKAEARASENGYDSDEVEEAFTCGSNKCLCGKPLKNNPEWKWITSKKGFRAIMHFQTETRKRDQDAFGEYYYNDFTGYGFQEAVNNELQAFHEDYTKAKPDPLSLWYRITGFANVIPGNGLWLHCDDCDQLQETMRLLGAAVLVTLDVLEKHNLLSADSKVKDLSLVLAMCLDMVSEWEPIEDEVDWRITMIEKVEARGIQISGLFGIEAEVAKLKTEFEDGENDWNHVDWKKMFKEFTKNHRYAGSKKIGGTQFDITKGRKGGGKYHPWGELS